MKISCLPHIHSVALLLVTADGPSAPSASCHWTILYGKVIFYKTFESDHANSSQGFIQMKNYYISVYPSATNFCKLVRKKVMKYF